MKSWDLLGLTREAFVFDPVPRVPLEITMEAVGGEIRIACRRSILLPEKKKKNRKKRRKDQCFPNTNLALLLTVIYILSHLVFALVHRVQ